jgi:competence protein ComEA
VLRRSTIGVLGVLVSGLALSALAAQPREPPTAASHALAPPRKRAPAPSSAALRALRDGERIAINSARAADLELLPGIGPTLARRIIEHRDAHGAFAAAEALLDVHGIGPRTLERLRPLLSFDAPHSSNTNTSAAATAK